MRNLLKPSGLAGKISLFTFAASILWILVISTTLLYLEYRLNERAVILNIQEVGKSNSASISRSVWEFERELLKTQLKAIVQLPSVSYIRLDETDGTISEFGNKSQRYPKKITFNIEFVDRGEIIRLGLLTIYPDLESLNKNLTSLALKIFSVQTMNAFVVAIIIFVLFYLFAGRHLTDIAAQASGLSADHLECPITLNRRPKPNRQDDELDILETALNDMRTHLINAFSELKTSEERHRRLFETMRQGVIYKEPGGNILSANPAASQILGIDENRLASMTSYDSDWDLAREDGSPIPPSDQPGMIALTTGKAVMDEVLSVYNPRLKERRWLKVNAVPLIRHGDTTPYQAHLTFDDITRWKQSRELINRYVHIISSTNDLMSFIDDQYIYQAVNDSYLKYHNKKRDEIIGFSIPELMGTEVFEFVVKPNFDRAMGGDTINFQEWFDYPKMGRRYMSVTYSPFYEEKDLVNGVVVSAHDMTGIKLAEFEIRDLRNYLSNIIDSMPSQIIGVDQDGLVTQWNMTIEMKTGITSKSAVGKALTDLIPQMAPEMEKVAQSIRTGKAVHNPKRPCLLNDEKRFEEMTIYPLIADGVSGAVIRIDDVTEKIQMEEMMVQSEKMLSVGGLAAGMAHEINNPLAGMLQTANVMAGRLSGDMVIPANLVAAQKAGTTMETIQAFMEDREIPRMIRTINESGRRVADIVDNMLSFARKGDERITPHSLARLLDKTLKLAATDYDLKKEQDFRHIRVVREYDESISAIPCEGAKIQQVLLNIFRNGAQAMQDAGTSDPAFVIRTRLEQDMVCLEIQDNGPGMDETVRRRVFEPFFTTKPIGEGTGLGLSVSYFIIVENHGGDMTVESSPGAGTTFTIKLPVKGRS